MSRGWQEFVRNIDRGVGLGDVDVIRLICVRRGGVVECIFDDAGVCADGVMFS